MTIHKPAVVRRSLALALGTFLFAVPWAAPGAARPSSGREVTMAPHGTQVQRQQQPARDQAGTQAETGTGNISGHVMDNESGRPVKRARVLLVSSAVSGGRGAMTDATGYFSFSGLPAGQYNINVSKTGYITVSHGQRRPLRIGRPLTLRDGEEAANIDFRLPKGSVISGHVLDEDGEPLIGVRVQALRYQNVQGQQRLLPAGSGSTDDRGYYRVYALQPGNYYVNATARSADVRVMIESRLGVTITGTAVVERGLPSADPASAPRGYAPTYYPGVTSLVQAGVVTLALSQEMTGVDFALQLVPTARVGGYVLNPDGSAATGAQVTLLADDGRNMTGGMSYSGRTRADGTFTIENVPPGTYLGVARTGGGGRAARQGGSGTAAIEARQSLTVAGQDVNGFVLTLVPGATIQGSVVFESGGTPAPAQVGRITVSANPLEPMPMDRLSSTRLSVDGTFALENISPGTRLLRVSGVPRPWALKAIYLNGRDVSDTPIDLDSNERATGVSIVLTDRTTEVTGTVPAGEDEVLLDYLVVAFSTDRTHWVPQSRRIQTARPDADGIYRITGLPPGDYLFVAIDDAEQNEWYDTSFLEEIRSAAARVTLVEGEVKTQELRLMEWR